MAWSGTINGSFSGNQNLKLRVDWVVESQNAAAKTSTVKLYWIAQRTTTATTTYKTNAAWTQKVGGATPSSTSGTKTFDIRSTAANTDYEYRRDTVVIQHDANGAKNASLSGTIDLSGTSAKTGSVTGSMSLPTIAVDPPVVDSVSVSDVGTGVSAVGLYVATKSKIQITATAHATQTGASIASYAFYANGNLLQNSASATYTGANYAVAGSYTIKVVAKDTNGLTAEMYYQQDSEHPTGVPIVVNAYSLPVITATTYRSNSSSQPDNDGTFAYCSLDWSVASVGTNEAVAYSISVNGNTYDETYSGFQPPNPTPPPAVILEPNIYTTSNYEVVYSVTDKLGGSATLSQTIQVSFINFDLFPSSSGGGVAFGEVAVLDKMIVNHSETILRGDLTKDDKVGGNLTIKQMGTNGINYDEFVLPQTGAVSTDSTYDIITGKVTEYFTENSNDNNKKFFSNPLSGAAAAITFRRYGKLASVWISFQKSTATAAGSNVFTATVLEPYRPLSYARGVGYYSSSACIVGINPNGSLTARIIGAQLGAGNDIGCGFMYMLA